MFNLFKKKSILEIAWNETNNNNVPFKKVLNQLKPSEKLLENLNEYFSDKNRFSESNDITMMFLEFIEDNLFMYLQLAGYHQRNNNLKSAFEFYSLAFFSVHNNNGEYRLLYTISELLKISIRLNFFSNNDLYIKKGHEVFNNLEELSNGLNFPSLQYDISGYSVENNYVKFYTLILIYSATYFCLTEIHGELNLTIQKLFKINNNEFRDINDFFENYKNKYSKNEIQSAILDFKTKYSKLQINNL